MTDAAKHNDGNSKRLLKPSTRPTDGAGTWGAYWDGLFPPRLVTPWINFKRLSSGVNVARRLWDQREDLRCAYESVHGNDSATWPDRHPGIVLDAVQWIAHAACLGCNWFDAMGHDMRDRLPEAAENARRHQISNGLFRRHYMAARLGIIDPAEAAEFDHNPSRWNMVEEA
jgi:hypothetical protein